MNPPTASAHVPPPAEVEADADVLVVVDDHEPRRIGWRARRAARKDGRAERPPRPTWPSRIWAVVIGLAFLLPVMTPLVLMANGVRPDAVDNRELADLPDAVDVAALDKGALDGVQSWFRDNLPGLDVAIRADATFDVAIRGTSPNPDVILGREDWLFLEDAVDQPCFGDADIAAIEQTFARLQRAARDGGRQLVLLVVPAKAAIHRDQLRAADRAASCARQNAELLAARLENPNILVPLDLLDERRDAGLPSYRALDSHWTDEASHAVVRELVSHLGLDPSDATEVPFSVRNVPEDLRVLQGLPGRRDDPCWRMDRPGVTVDGYVEDCIFPIDEPIVSTATTDGAAALLPPTTFVFDSFGQRMLEVMPSWFQRLSGIYKPDLQDLEIGDEVARSRIVVLEAVQRRLPSLLGRPELVDALVDALATPAAP